MKRERDELIRKETMAEMFLKRENSTFWDTPGKIDKFVANSFLNIVTSNFNYQVTKLSQLPTSTSSTQKYCKLFQI